MWNLLGYFMIVYRFLEMWFTQTGQWRLIADKCQVLIRFGIFRIKVSSSWLVLPLCDHSKELELFRACTKSQDYDEAFFQRPTVGRCGAKWNPRGCHWLKSSNLLKLACRLQKRFCKRPEICNFGIILGLGFCAVLQPKTNILVCLFACLSACLLACLVGCLLACLLACLVGWLVVCLFVCLFVYLRDTHTWSHTHQTFAQDRGGLPTWFRASWHGMLKDFVILLRFCGICKGPNIFYLFQGAQVPLGTTHSRQVSHQLEETKQKLENLERCLA